MLPRLRKKEFKMKLHPMCGYKVEKLLKPLIGLDVTLTAIALHLTILGIGFQIGIGMKWINQPTSPLYTIEMRTLVIISIFLIMDIILDIWLWVIVSELNVRKTLIWILIRSLFEFSDLIGFVVEVTLRTYAWVYIMFMLMDFVFTMYLLWVVATFWKEMKIKRGLQSTGNGIFSLLKSDGDPNSVTANSLA